MITHIEGLKVDADAIGKGLYAIICEQGQEAIVAFGMLPADIIELAERLIREKVIALAAEQNHMTPADAKEYIDPDALKRIVSPVMRAVCSGIYSAASACGKMVV